VQRPRPVNGLAQARVAESSEQSVLAQLAELPSMSMADLRNKWKTLNGSDPPPAFSRTILIGRLAYRTQEVAFGGLKPATVTRLDALARQIDRAVKSGGKAKTKAPRDRPVVGTRLIREWRGVEHCVTVRVDGYEYQGRPYKSLSAIARAIAGSQWNGWAFFGLRSPAAGAGR
jgi:hypothetical protein